MVGFWKRLKTPTLRPIGCGVSAVPDGAGLRWERDKPAFGATQDEARGGTGKGELDHRAWKEGHGHPGSL